MTRLLLDTTFLIDAERSAGDLDEAIADSDDVAIAAITAAELLVGVELASDRHRPGRSAFAEAVIRGVSVLAYDVATARIHAELVAAVRRQGRPRGAHDLIIAATAARSGRSVVTADSNAFDDLPGVSVMSHCD